MVDASKIISDHPGIIGGMLVTLCLVWMCLKMKIVPSSSNHFNLTSFDIILAPMTTNHANSNVIISKVIFDIDISRKYPFWKVFA